MILIIGGYCQGKLEFAKQKFGLQAEEITHGENCEIENAFDARALNQLHLYVKRLIQSDIEPIAFFSRHMDALKDQIILSDEIGLGVVPIDEQERTWREAVGRVCCLLAKNASEVYRLYAGLPVKIKG